MMEVWRKCSSCKNDIIFGQKYFVCSVSTCQGKVTNYAFCSIGCWDAHVPVERHRSDSAGAIERVAPKSAMAAEPVRKIIPAPAHSVSAASTAKIEDEILVVVSKVRKYISERSGMNTSAEVYELLTDRLKRLCDRAVEEARTQGRKTVMARDFR